MTAGKFRSVMLGSAVAALVVSTAACNRGNDESVATVEKQAASPVQEVRQPITVTGCLRAGDATNTFVVTTPESSTGESTATYQLVQPQDVSVNLTELVGRQVQVEGTLQTQQRVTTRSTADPPSGPPAGTTGKPGTPAVSTTTELDIKRLDVQRVTPVAGECTT